MAIWTCCDQHSDASIWHSQVPYSKEMLIKKDLLILSSPYHIWPASNVPKFLPATDAQAWWSTWLLMPQLKGLKWAVKLGLVQDDSRVPDMFWLYLLVAWLFFTVTCMSTQRSPGLQVKKKIQNWFPSKRLVLGSCFIWCSPSATESWQLPVHALMATLVPLELQACSNHDAALVRCQRTLLGRDTLASSLKLWIGACGCEPSSHLWISRFPSSNRNNKSTCWEYTYAMWSVLVCWIVWI